MAGRTAAARTAEAARVLRVTMLELGYPPESVQLYARLLLQGPHTPAKAEAATGLAAADLHVAARALIKDRLVFEDRDGHKTVWYCRDPSMAWLTLAADATWSVSSALSPLEDLPATGQPEVDRRRELLLQALAPALSLWKPHYSITRHKHTRAPNARILAQLAVEAVDLAKTHVRAISASPKVSTAAAFWPVIERKLKYGITYTRLADVMEVYEHGLDTVECDLARGVELLLGLQAELAVTRGYLSDKRILVKYDSAPLGQRPESGVMTSDPHAIRKFVRKFDKLASTAVPAQMVVDRLRVIGESLRGATEALGPDATAWIDEMIRMGKFATLPKQRGWSARYCEQLISKLVDERLLHVNEDGLRLPAWPDADEFLVEVRNAAH